MTQSLEEAIKDAAANMPRVASIVIEVKSSGVYVDLVTPNGRTQQVGSSADTIVDRVWRCRELMKGGEAPKEECPPEHPSMCDHPFAPHASLQAQTGDAGGRNDPRKEGTR